VKKLLLHGLPLSYRQLDFVTNSDAFINLAEGAIRSGKSASGLLRWLIAVAAAPKRGDLVVTAKTYDTAQRNIFGPLQDAAIFGPFAKATSYTRGASTAKILGRTIEVITFNDARAEQRLRGMTCASAYVDEWTLMGESFHEQLISRCSLDGAQIFGNTNPDNPRHWLRLKMLAAARGEAIGEDWKTWKFELDDNPGLSEKAKGRYRRQFTGLWYQRMILGKWVMAEGAIYPMWDEAKHVVKTLPTITRWISLGIDYGTTNPFSALLLGVGTDGLLYLTREWRWDSKRRMQALTDLEYSQKVRAWLDVEPEWWCVDPAAASFRLQLHRDGIVSTPAHNGVVDGIRLIGSLLHTGLLRVHESCEGWIEEIPGYTWDPKLSLEKGLDEPVKLDDHSLDAGRYGIKTTEVVWRDLVRDAYDLAA
jgi:PBSX family phage terminase large subunit